MAYHELPIYKRTSKSSPHINNLKTWYDKTSKWKKKNLSYKPNLFDMRETPYDDNHPFMSYLDSFSYLSRKFLYNAGLGNGVPNPSNITSYMDYINLSTPPRSALDTLTFYGWDVYYVVWHGTFDDINDKETGTIRHIAYKVKLNSSLIYATPSFSLGTMTTKENKTLGVTTSWTVTWTGRPSALNYDAEFYGFVNRNGVYSDKLVPQVKNVGVGRGMVVFEWNTAEIKYTVEFHDENNYRLHYGSIYPNRSISYTIPSKTGYNAKWSLPSGGGSVSGNTITLLSSSDIVAKATYTLITYTISYNYLTADLRTGYTNSNASSYNITSNTITLSTSMFKTKNGYSTPVWTEGGSVVSTIPKGSTGNRYFTLSYPTIDYTITYDTMGGIGNHNNPVSYNIESDTIYLSQGNMTRTGYTFDGWYTAKTGGSKVSSVNKGSYGNKTFYARWIPKTYNITYNLNGGEIYDDSYYPESYNIESQIILNKDYIFRAGYKIKDFKIGNDIVVQIGPNMIGDITIDVIWEVITYSYIINDMDGALLYSGSYNINTSDIILSEKVDIPDWPGYTIRGIYTSEDPHKITIIPKGSTGDFDLVVLRDIIDYNITYFVNGGEGDHNNPVSYNIESDTIDISQGNMTRTGYTFLGWFDNNDNQVLYISKGSTGDISLQAKWQVINYTITLKDRLGNNYTLGNNSFNIETETFNISSRLANPTETGYTFEGWFEEAFNFSNEVTQVIKGTTEDIVLYSKWSIKEYSIRLYDENENHLATQNYTIESDDILLSDIHPDLSWNGYTFLGWYTASTGGSKVTKVSSGSTGNKKYYAQRSIITYSITYDLQNGLGSHSNPTSYTVEDKVTLTQGNIFREGYEFLGWYNNPTKGSKVTEISKGSYGDVVVYARWNLLEYTITYQLNGGVNNEGNPTKYTPITDDITFLNPTRPHYIFVDWKINNTVVFGIPKGSTGNKTVVASWTPQPYLINYVLQGGSGSHGNKTTYNIEQQVNFVQGNLRRSGYTFKGWYDSPTGGNKITVFNVGTSGNKTLYAQWTEITYSITYTMNGGINHIDNPNSFTPETDNIILKNPTRTGYTFNGWYEGNTKITNIPKGSIGNKTIEARWTIITYSITYELNGGSGDVSNPLTYTIETADINLSSSGVTRLGYNFDKFTSAGSTITKIPKGSIGDRTITYNWTIINYSVTFDADGGSPVNDIIYNVNTPTITLPNTSKNGYTFSGWFEGGVRYTSIPKGSVGNRNFKAIYNINSYNIIFKNQDDEILQQGEQIFNNNLVFNQPTPTYTPTQNKIMSVFKFEGWSTNKNANPDQAKTLAQLGTNNDGKISSDMNNYTLYAIYSERVNSIRIGNSELKTTSTIGNKNIKEIRVGNKLVWEKDYK